MSPVDPASLDTNQVVPAMSLLDGHTLLALSSATSPGSLGSLAMIGRYKVLRLLGAGGMGIVVLARDPNLPDGHADSLVAIKILRLEFRNSAIAVKRFVTEATHMSRLAHPHILRVLEIQSEVEPAFYVMPYLAAGPLSKVINPDRGMARERILQLAIPVAQAIAFAHGRGIIHRDLKPANILLTDDGEPRVADFGLVRTVYNDSIVDPSRDLHEGSAAYMSPAIAEGNAEDTRCDIYSFGATLYEMLTGRPPYEGRTAIEVMRKIRAGAPEPIRKFRSDADRGLSEVSARCMERRLSDRYASMQDVVDDLERCRAGKQLSGRRPLITRRRIVVAGAGTIAAAAIGMPWWFSRDQYKPKVIASLGTGGGWSSHFSHDSKWIIHSSKQSLYIRDARTLQLVREISGLPVEYSVLWFADVSPDLKTIAFSTDLDEHSVRVAEIDTGRFLYEHSPGGPRQVRFLRDAPDRNQLAIACPDMGEDNLLVQLLDLNTFKLVGRIFADRPVRNVHAIGEVDGFGTIASTDLGLGFGKWSSGEYRLEPNTGRIVKSISKAFGMSSAIRITGTEDGTVEFRRTGTIAHTIRAHDAEVSFACLYSDGRYGRTVGGKIPQILGWDIENTRIISRVDLGWLQSRRAVVSPDGALASVCDEYDRLLVLQLPDVT